MTKFRSFMPATVRGSLTAAVALLAGLNVAHAQAPAPAAPLSGAGSFPGSFIVPGTQTSIHVGGFITVDTYFDFDAPGATSPGANQNAYPGGNALEGPTIVGPAAPSASHNEHGVFRINPNATRIYTETRTPTAYGELKTYWEIDFKGTYSAAGGTSITASTIGVNCCSNNGTPRMTQAYGTLGPWLIGMTNSNFADLDALSDTLDAFVEAGGFMGAGTAKEPQIRFTYLLPFGISVAASAEQAQSAGIFSTSANGLTGAALGIAAPAFATNISGFNNFDNPGMSQRIPAFTVKGRIDQPWGHTALALAVMQERFQNLASGVGPFGSGNGAFGIGANDIPVGSHAARWGFHLTESGHFNTFGKDKVTWLASYGQGAAQYNWALFQGGTQFEEGLVCSATSATLAPAGNTGRSYNCSQPRTIGINVGYSHWWTDEWRSGVAFGYDHESKPSAASGWIAAPLTVAGTTEGLNMLERQHMSGTVNLQWTPVPQAQFGIEFEWYRHQVWSGAHGTHERLETQALFKF